MTEQPDTARPLRWAILGTGIVARKFACGLASAGPPMRLVTAASRRAEAAQDFAGAVKGCRVAPNYASAAQDPEVDAVYIATPPAQHEDHAMLAIAAGKAVLIEKPFALDAPAARRIADAARAQGVFCMEAMWTRFLPLYDKIRARVSAGALGELRGLQASFMGSDRVDAGTSLFDPARGGGALMHRGVYGVSMALHLLGPVQAVQAVGRVGDTGVDEDCTLILRHESGALSTIMASLRASARNDLLLTGTEGRIEVAAPIFRPHKALLWPTRPRAAPSGAGKPGRLAGLRETGFAQRLNAAVPQALRARLGRAERIAAPFAGNGYGHEAAALAAALRDGATEAALMPLSDSVAVMEVLDAARAQIHAQGDPS